MNQPAFDPRLGSWRSWYDPDARLRLGVSSCLLGETVRYDGGHARDRFVRDVLGDWFEWVPACPEVEIGLGVPRPTIRLELAADGDDLRLVCPATGADLTRTMREFARRRVRAPDCGELDGYILKKNSPSCGMERVKVHAPAGGVRNRSGRGIFAAELLDRHPELPVEEEGRLNDPGLRETFIERVFCRNRWRRLVARGMTRRHLVAFHTAHKLLLRAHNEAGYRRLGRIVAAAGRRSDRALFAEYAAELDRTMATRATVKKHVNVLEHAAGYLKTALPPAEKRELHASIGDYRAGLLPLIVPLTLLRFNIRRFGVDYLAGQIYFDPHPRELMLRNHA